MADEQLEQLQKIIELSEERNRQLEMSNNLESESVKIAKEKLATQEEEVKKIKKEIEELQKLKNEQKFVGDLEKIRQEGLKKTLQEKIDLLDQQTQAYREQQEELDKLEKKQKEVNDEIRKGKDILRSMFSGNFSRAAKKALSSVGDKIEKDLTKKLLDARMAGGGLGKALGAIAGPAIILALVLFTKAIFDLAITVGNAENAFMKTTGASEDFARSLSDSYIQTRKFGASIEETSTAMNSLFTSFTDFTMVGEKTRKNLTQTATVMAKLGVSTDDFAKGIQSLTKAMGFNADAAAQQLLNLEKFAEELGVAPSKIASDFAGAGGSLAKFGDRGVETFKRLEVASKITGMAFERILAITEKFDTFEGAATQAGKLNAALGGNFVNAMDLMMQTDPVGRMEQIRDAILSTGMSFDDMTYYQKNMYKEMLGLQDVGELALLLSGRTDLMADSFNKSAQSYEEAAERAKTVASFQEQLQILFAEMIPIITPVIDVLRTFVKILQPLAPIIGLLAKFIGLALTLSFIFSPSGILVMGITAISNVFVNMAGGIERINKQMDDFIEGWSKFARRLFHTRNSPTIFEGVGMLNDMFEDMDQNIQGTTVSIRAQTAELNNSPVPSVAETTANIETPSLAERAIRTFTGGEQNATQTVEKPVELVLNGDKLGKFIVKVVGESIKTISIAQ